MLQVTVHVTHSVTADTLHATRYTPHARGSSPAGSSPVGCHIQLQQTRDTRHATRHTHAVVALSVVALSRYTPHARCSSPDGSSPVTLHATRTL